LDSTISESLKAEGIARELVNRVQNLRKDSGLDVTDRIALKIDTSEAIQVAISENQVYVCAEVLADSISFESLTSGLITDLEAPEDARIELIKL
jgi:isoleucyl-tRNA synthetase